MKTAAVITEFNPFHNGHEYFLREVRKRSGADVLIAVMSGDFVQRGEPAVLNKFVRTEAALKGGCDIVLELPVRNCLSSAGGFAEGAVSIIDSLGIADELWFGSECGDIQKIRTVAEVLSDEPEDFRSALQAGLKEGLSYPASRALALSKIYGTSYAGLLDAPNNILGIEYCIAAARLKSNIRLHTLQRVGSAYDDSSTNGDYPSALAIRSILYRSRFENDPDLIPALAAPYLPSCSSDLVQHSKGFLFADDFSDILRIRLMEETQDSLYSYLNMTQDLARRIKNTENEYLSFTDFTARLKSRNYTYSHISRALMSIVLKLTADAPVCSDSLRFIRLLGMKKSAESALRVIHENASVELITSPTQLPKDVFKEELYASALYESIFSVRFHTPFIHESSRKFLKF